MSYCAQCSIKSNANKYEHGLIWWVSCAKAFVRRLRWNWGFNPLRRFLVLKHKLIHTHADTDIIVIVRWCDESFSWHDIAFNRSATCGADNILSRAPWRRRHAASLRPCRLRSAAVREGVRHIMFDGYFWISKTKNRPTAVFSTSSTSTESRSSTTLRVLGWPCFNIMTTKGLMF